jgi:hypothetical protein
MKKIRADQSPQLTVEVSEQERATAKAAKKEFKAILKDLGDSLKIIFDLREAIIQERPSKEDLKSRYKGRLLRYRRKISKSFNDLLLRLQSAIQSLQNIMDPEMKNLQKILVAEFDELSDGVEGVLELLGESERDGFTKDLERLCTQLQQRKISIDEVVDNQLFNHLEQDILGKIKISSLKARIRRRTRLLRKISTENNLWDL